MFPRLRLFRVFGIDVFLHWSWFLVAAIEISDRKGMYSSTAWNVAEYVSLFVIVLLHEFGHSLACRQVGGVAERIVLWPLGGVAYASPPPRPGALLWTIAAGPLVNVVLLPIFWLVKIESDGWADSSPDAWRLAHMLFDINLTLLVFNMLPIYPLDGGQILRALLWYPLGMARSLMASLAVGLVGGLGLIAFAVWQQSYWLGIIAIFILSRCWQGYQQARIYAQLPRGDAP